MLLHTATSEETLGVSPRPVFYEELDLLGLNKLGWYYPHCKEPLMWAVNKQYWYRGLHLFDVKGADIYTPPTVVLQEGIEPMELTPVNVKTMLKKNSALMFVLENEAIEFIRDTYTAYTKVNRTYSLTKTNQLDYEALALRTEKKKKERMAVVKQDCDSFDVMPLATAQKEGKRVLLSTKIDRFIASFSGGKDSQVVLDLCTRAIPPTAYEVIYSDTGYELPSSLELYEEIQKHYKKKFPSLKFSTARNHESVLNYWDKIGTPSDTHRWCCTVMKTAPLYRKLKVEGNKQAHVLTFDGVRAEESTRRSNYERIGKGKHTFVYNAHPILRWNSVEIFLYLFEKDLPINIAYRFGITRVGCAICPFSTSWNDMGVHNAYPTVTKQFIDQLRLYSYQAKISNFENYLAEGKWKLKPLCNRNLPISEVSFKGHINSLNFEAKIVHPHLSYLNWLPALCPYSIHKTKSGYRGELKFMKKVYPYEIKETTEESAFKVYGIIPNELVFLLRRLVYKTAYCINCEVCEVDCPTGALAVVPSVKIDTSKCIHCLKCYNIYDRGCIVADNIRMVMDTDKKLNAKIHSYKNFGFRDEWVDEYSKDIQNFWVDNTLGTAQIESFKAWLRDADITDAKNILTPLGRIMMRIYDINPQLFWETAYVNLSYNSFIVAWFTSNILENQIYSTRIIKEEIDNQEYSASTTTIGNAASALCDMIKKTPIGEDFKQGLPANNKELRREAYQDLSLEAVAYSVYRFASIHETNILRVSDFYKPEEKHGVYKEFLMPKQELIRKLRSLSNSSNRVLVAELNMGLEHITLRNDLSAMTVLEQMAL